jgi:LysR family glycine cleavage system transcriptional activator
MRRKIPSTTALVAFEAAARHQSFTLAGEELALTQSAVGRQIASLEGLIQVKLFRRTRRGVALTAAGLQYSAAVRQRLADVERDALDLASRSAGGGSIELGVVPTFATHWLVPRLSRFYAAQPSVRVNLHVRTRPFLFEEAGLDAAIHAGQGGWPGTRADLLMEEPMRVVCAPALIRRRKSVTPEDLASLPLIQMTTRPDAWRHWFVAHGVAAEGDVAGPRVELFSMAVKAAVHGLGVALVPEYVTQDELRRELLISPVRECFPSGLAYYFIQPESNVGPPALGIFRAWLLDEANTSGAG